MHKSIILFILLFPSICFAQVNIGPNVWSDTAQNIGIGTIASSGMVVDIVGTVRSTSFVGNGALLTNLPPSAIALAITNSVSHSLVSSTSATGFQINATKPAMAFYSVKISTTANIGGGAEGEIYLETAATNSTTPSDWSMASKVSNSQSYTLAIALQGVQGLGQPLLAMIPAGYYTRLRTNNVTGTPTYAYLTGQETVIG